jgi:hypothetical protein
LRELLPGRQALVINDGLPMAEGFPVVAGFENQYGEIITVVGRPGEDMTALLDREAPKQRALGHRLVLIGGMPDEPRDDEPPNAT